MEQWADIRRRVLQEGVSKHTELGTDNMSAQLPSTPAAGIVIVFPLTLVLVIVLLFTLVQPPSNLPNPTTARGVTPKFVSCSA